MRIKSHLCFVHVIKRFNKLLFRIHIVVSIKNVFVDEVLNGDRVT